MSLIYQGRKRERLDRIEAKIDALTNAIANLTTLQTELAAAKASATSVTSTLNAEDAKIKSGQP